MDPKEGDLVLVRRPPPFWDTPKVKSFDGVLGVVLEVIDPTLRYPAGRALVSMPDGEAVWMYWREINIVDSKAG